MNMKKVLSIFLALALMLGIIPGMSFAVSAEDEPAAETATITYQQTSGTMTVSLPHSAASSSSTAAQLTQPAAQTARQSAAL